MRAIASLGGVAASGGYYLAISADRVIAESTTIAGSIGVTMVDVNAAGVLHKIGRADTSGAGRRLAVGAAAQAAGSPDRSPCICGTVEPVNHGHARGASGCVIVAPAVDRRIAPAA